MRVEKKVILMVPYPAQGHLTPMVELAANLPAALGFTPIIVLPEFLHRQLTAKTKAAEDGVLLPEHLQTVSIEDGLHEDESKGFFEIEKAMEVHMPAQLERLIRGLEEGGAVVACVVADLLASWAVLVAKRCGVAAAGYWPAMLATYRLISSIPDMLQAGLIDQTGIPVHHGPISLKADLPTINTEDLPWLIGSLPERQSKFKFWVRTLNRARSLQYLLVNSFPCETEITKSAKQALISPQENSPTFLPVGLPKRFSADQQAQRRSPRLTFWAEDSNCLGWLDQQKPNSVLYVSFGTWFGPIDDSKVKILASSLEALGRPFLWALGPKWADGLPDGFIERVSDLGKVVAWAPQVQVLKHKAVGCFLTHCGWNSIREAISCKKRVLCYPLAGDQQLNCVYAVDVWKIGVRIKSFDVEELKEKANKVMGDVEMKRRMVKLHERFMGEEARLKMTANLAFFLAKVANAMLFTFSVSNT